MSRTALVAAFVLAALGARADEAFITNQGGNSLSIIDLSAMKSVATLDIGGKPAGVAVSSDGARAYVTSPDGKYVTVIDAVARKIVKRIAVSGAPLGVAVSPDGARIYVVLTYDAKLLEIDPETEGKRELAVGAMASGVQPMPDGRFLLVADRDDNALSIIDLAEFKRVATIPVGKHPFGVAISADGARAYTANVESDDMSVIDLAARKIVATLPTGSRPYTVALAADRIFVADQHADTVSVFDAKTLAPAGKIDVGEYPEGVAASHDGKTIYAACWFSNELYAIDAATLKILGKTSTGEGPRAFGSFVRTTP